ncbi:MAG: cation:dicarboxylate symporter family transporter [Enterocloster clostridioformis]
MGYAPIGICALMACTVGTYGAQLGGFLAKYLGASYVCVLIQIAVYGVLLTVFGKCNPFWFLKKASPFNDRQLSEPAPALHVYRLE